MPIPEGAPALPCGIARPPVSPAMVSLSLSKSSPFGPFSGLGTICAVVKEDSYFKAVSSFAAKAAVQRSKGKRTPACPRS